QRAGCARGFRADRPIESDGGLDQSAGVATSRRWLSLACFAGTLRRRVRMARAERQELLSQQLLSQESKWGDPFRLVLLAPVIFPIHVAEETAGGFVAWFN